jgi:hypothetical protein
MSKIIKEQEQLIEQQRIEFETTIAKKVMESEETMNLLMKNLNKSMSASRVGKWPNILKWVFIFTFLTLRT